MAKMKVHITLCRTALHKLYLVEDVIIPFILALTNDSTLEDHCEEKE